MATLAGSGVASYRTAILWGAVTTSAGALVSGSLAGRLLELFARGVVAAPPTPDFALAVACGSAGWVGLATITRFPVSGLLVMLVAGTMLVGSLYAGRRVARVLAQGVVRMEHREGLLANLSTSLLVGIGANLGLPMSTTHVSAGAIAGIAGEQPKRLNRKTLRDLALAWTVTPLAAAIIAATTYTATRLF